MLHLRQATASDHDAVWAMFRAVVAGGDVYVFEKGITREEALAYWFHTRTHTFVAEHAGRVVGSYILKANQPGRGSHVANGSYMVAPDARGLGVGQAMGKHSIAQARRLGFRAIQFNIVVATNEAAVKLWQKLGFSIVGTLPGAFRHARLGYVDAYVMYLTLDESPARAPS